MDAITDLDYIDYDGQRALLVRRPVIAETPWALYLDRRALVTLMCTPTDLHCLALGFLRSEGLIGGLEDLWQLRVHLEEDRVHLVFPEAGLNTVVALPTCAAAVGSIDVRLRRPAPPPPERRVITSGCGGGISFDDLSGDRPPLTSDLRIHASALAALMRQLNQAATLYRTSRGVHTSALADSEQLLVLAEDVGRHNTIDKLRGACMLRGISTHDRILLSSGRISSEMIGKARKMEVPLVVSRTSPTVTSVRLAQRWNMTLVGYARGQQLRVYAGVERIVFDNERLEA